MVNLQQKAEDLYNNQVFLGGPVHQFEAVGRMQLITLLREGLYPDSKLVDIGCGCLRAGYWLIHFLNKGCYCGLEPHQERLDSGLKYILEPETFAEKQPRFDRNSDFNTAVFGEKFDFFLARSIWTHTSKGQIQTMLDAFERDASDQGVFLTSYLRATSEDQDYQGDHWVGKNHKTDEAGTVLHRFEWIASECEKRNLKVQELEERPDELFNNQIWLKIMK